VNTPHVLPSQRLATVDRTVSGTAVGGGTYCSYGSSVPKVKGFETVTGKGVPVPLRRVPVQERSAARVQRMLDACAGLVDEVGYDGLTTTSLAERAGVAIGSVYQFFPDKRAVVAALTARNLDVFLARISDRFASAHLGHWWEGVDAVIDEYIAMYRLTPGFRGLRFGDIVDVHLLSADRDNNAVIVDRLRALLTDRFGLTGTARVELALAIAVETGDALIKLAFRRDPAGDPVVITEAKDMIREYLSHHVG
jgi:AcrR family transcriptional regulator